MTDKELLKQIYEIFKTLVPTKHFGEYAETLVKIRRELGIPLDKKKVFLVGGNFHGQSVDENSVEYKWPPFKYKRHDHKLPVCVPGFDDIAYELPDDVYDLVRFTSGDFMYVYRETISYNPKDY
jgi:hypothetical protein